MLAINPAAAKESPESSGSEQSPLCSASFDADRMGALTRGLVFIVTYDALYPLLHISLDLARSKEHLLCDMFDAL